MSLITHSCQLSWTVHFFHEIFSLVVVILQVCVATATGGDNLHQLIDCNSDQLASRGKYTLTLINGVEHCY